MLYGEQTFYLHLKFRKNIFFSEIKFPTVLREIKHTIYSLLLNQKFILKMFKVQRRDALCIKFISCGCGRSVRRSFGSMEV